ncbi:DUF1127 domain-containing protein [Vineibacter terrae]|uniref:DUF1127 domain-containing protein n=1 Tax=Vineibacter terrae TaxID=2586908 RepID=A0A5C8PD10_9HYPH|nr:DUF1127 domain-containing protein [Vineibacter terrae]TXL71483.1 DUF1127 domain-containing protein [Vineibacter terrae]
MSSLDAIAPGRALRRARPAAWLVRRLARLQAYAEKHRSIDALLALDDRLLADIGLSRGARIYVAQHRRLPDRRTDAV